MRTSQDFNVSKILIRASKAQRIRAAIVLAVIAAVSVPVFLMAHGVIDPDRVLDPCGFKQRTHLPCPTCGMTHAVLDYARGRVLKSFYTQPAAALICTFTIIAAILAFLTASFGIYYMFFDSLLSQMKVKYVILILIVVVAAGWAVTLARAIATNAEG